MVDLSVAGPNLRVRLPRADDAAALYRHASDPEVTRWFSWGPYESEREAGEFLAGLPELRARGEQLDFVIEHREAGTIGVSGLSELSVRDRRATIGTWLGRRWWATGANHEAKALMCHAAFALLGLERVGAYANVGHERSQRALERIGFQREGVLRSFHRHGGRSVDVVVFSLLREDWLAGPLRAVPVEVSGAAPSAWVVLA
ncbi:MAG TPA: GNAT family protein [Solirubrobacteraceae bacterium]|nr:GNAT family protein [Solirubrobacteraceae bacterium]